MSSKKAKISTKEVKKMSPEEIFEENYKKFLLKTQNEQLHIDEDKTKDNSITSSLIPDSSIKIEEKSENKIASADKTIEVCEKKIQSTPTRDLTYIKFLQGAFSSQIDMFREADRKGYKVLLSRDISEDGKKEYFCINDFGIFWNLYQNMPITSKSFYELQRVGTPRFEVYDLEIETKNLKPGQKLPTPMELFNHFLSLYPKRTDEAYFNIINEEPNWLVLDSSNNNKTSLHIINRNRIFLDEKDNKLWVEMYVKDSEEYYNFPDRCIYGKNHLFRIIGSTKMSKNRYLKIWNEHNKDVSDNPLDYFITHIRDDEKKRMETKLFIELSKEEVGEVNEDYDLITFDKLEGTDKTKKLRELCMVIINGIKNNEIESLKKDGKGVICHNNCMAICCAILYEDEKSEDLVDMFLNLYRNKETRDLKELKEAWKNSVEKRKNDKNSTKSTIGTLYFLAKQAGWNNESMPKNDRYFYKSLAGGEEDLVNLYIYITKNERFINTYDIKDKHHGYKLDLQTAIYQPYTKEKVINDIQNKLKIFVEKKINIHKKKLKKAGKDENKKMKKGEEDKDCELMKLMKKQLVKVKSVGFLEMLFTSLTYKVQDKSFKEKINSVREWEIPIKNRMMINLKTLEKRERTKDDLWSFFINRNYVEDTTRAYEYFLEIFDNNIEKMKCFLQFIGYSISPSMRLKKILICIGSADTGKSKTLTMIRKAVDENIMSSLSYKVLFSPKNEAVHDEEFMKCKKIRAGIIAEPESKIALSSEKVKKIVGGDMTDARRCAATIESFIPICKGIILMNQPPLIPNGNALKEKIIYCFFKHKFDKSEEKENDDKLTALESDDNFLDQVFSLIVKSGYDLHNSKSFYIPKCMKEESEDMNNETNSVFSFCKNKIKVADEKSGTPYLNKGTLYEKYKSYCPTNDYTPEKKYCFFEQLKEFLGVSEKKKNVLNYNGSSRNNIEIFEGYELIEDDK